MVNDCHTSKLISETFRCFYVLIIYLISISETHSNFYVPNTMTTTGIVILNLEVCIRLTGSFFKVHMDERRCEPLCKGHSDKVSSLFSSSQCTKGFNYLKHFSFISGDSACQPSLLTPECPRTLSSGLILLIVALI